MTISTCGRQLRVRKEPPLLYVSSARRAAQAGSLGNSPDTRSLCAISEGRCAV